MRQDEVVQRGVRPASPGAAARAAGAGREKVAECTCIICLQRTALPFEDPSAQGGRVKVELQSGGLLAVRAP